MNRKKTSWICITCGEFILEPYTKNLQEYTSSTMKKDGPIVRRVVTVEEQLEKATKCFEKCDGDAALSALDVQTADEYNDLNEDEQRRVAQQITTSSPIPLIIAVLEPAITALNHEDEDYVPAIEAAIALLGKLN